MSNDDFRPAAGRDVASGHAASSWRGLVTEAAPYALATYWLAMAVGTHLPPGPDGPVSINDKLLHFGGYFGLAVLLSVTFRRLPAAAVVAIAVGYGAIDELTQPPFGRTADVWDWVADFVGASLGALAGRRLLGRLISEPATSAASDAAAHDNAGSGRP